MRFFLIGIFFIHQLICPILLTAMKADYWQQKVHYTIQVKLNAEDHTLDGNEAILYTNNSPDTLTEIYFHLYPNAYKENSLMDREMAANNKQLFRGEENKGYLNIRNLEITNENNNINLITCTNFVQDETLLRVKLSEPLVPGDRLKISLEFTEKIRKYLSAGGKGGYLKDYYIVSQWYPKICVYDQNGWNKMPYHWIGEFYGEFGEFDVTIEVPFRYIVAATGTIIDGNSGWKTVAYDSSLTEERINKLRQQLIAGEEKTPMRKMVFNAMNVHDFVWVASPNFVYESGNYKNCSIHVIYSWEDRNSWASKILQRSKNALTWLDTKIGTYPYEQLVVAQGLGNHSMEYPMCAVLGMTRKSTVFHEIAHMYFYAALANNEQTEGWLDEGLVTFLTELYTNELNYKAGYISPITNKKIFEPTYYEIRLNYLSYYLYSDFETPISIPCYQNKDKVSYSLNSYVKGAFFFRMLKHVINEDAFWELLQRYYRQHRFKHVTEADFQIIAEQVSQLELDWFFQQWLHDTVNVDYALNSVNTKRLKSGGWKSKVRIERKSNGVMPVDVELKTEQGKKYTKRADGKKQFDEISFNTMEKPKEVFVDPADVILDQYRLNNGSLKLKCILYPDYPNLYYQPRNEYLLSCWPLLWYNAIDKLKIGTQIYGGYLNRFYLSRARIWWATGSRHPDFYWKLTHPVGLIRKSLWFNSQVTKNEGRILSDINIHYIKRPFLFAQPSIKWRIGITGYQVVDDTYIWRQLNDVTFRTWNNERIVKLYTHLEHLYDKNKLNNTLKIQMEYASERWGSERNFLKLCGENNFQLSLMKRLTLNIRNFGGAISYENKLPLQEYYCVAEGNPLLRFEKYYLRSRGSFPDMLKYHFPGDGNLRGFLTVFNDDMPLKTDRIFTTNLSLKARRLNLKISLLRKLRIRMDAQLFYDYGWFKLTNSWQFAADAGFGFTFTRKIFTRMCSLRIDFPIWLNKTTFAPQPSDGDKFGFRWVVSFQPAL